MQHGKGLFYCSATKTETLNVWKEGKKYLVCERVCWRERERERERERMRKRLGGCMHTRERWRNWRKWGYYELPPMDLITDPAPPRKQF